MSQFCHILLLLLKYLSLLLIASYHKNFFNILKNYKNISTHIARIIHLNSRTYAIIIRSYSLSNKFLILFV